MEEKLRLIGETRAKYEAQIKLLNEAEEVIKIEASTHMVVRDTSQPGRFGLIELESQEPVTWGAPGRLLQYINAAWRKIPHKNIHRFDLIDPDRKPVNDKHSKGWMIRYKYK